MVSKILNFADTKGGGGQAPHLQRWGSQCPPGPPGATPMNPANTGDETDADVTTVHGRPQEIFQRGQNLVD